MQFIDSDFILSNSQQWLDLEQKWGSPVDLDPADSKGPDAERLLPADSTLSLNRTTFDSAKYISKLKRAKKVSAELQDTLTDYGNFTEAISQYRHDMTLCSPPSKAFYFVAGSIVSRRSVENICEEIDDIFSCLEYIRVDTSTIRTASNRMKPLKNNTSSIVEHSVSMSNISFDDTATEKALDSGRLLPEAAPKISDASLIGIMGYIDQLFESLDETM